MFFMLCSIFFFFYVFVLCLSFIFSFILHPSCIIFHLCSYLLFFLSFLLIHLSICDKKGENILWLMCTFVGGEIHRGDAYVKGEKTFFYEKILFCLVFLYTCFLIILWCFELCLVSMLSCFHHIVFVCWTCIYPYVIVLFWLHVRMIIYFAIWLL